MAWAIPLVIAAVDYAQKQGQNDKVDQANQQLMGAMRGASGQVGQYRQDLRKQQMQAMQNQLGAYSGARGMLGSAMGNGPSLWTGGPRPAPSLPMARGMLGAMTPGPRPPGQIGGGMLGPIPWPAQQAPQAPPQGPNTFSGGGMLGAARPPAPQTPPGAMMGSNPYAAGGIGGRRF